MQLDPPNHMQTVIDSQIVVELTKRKGKQENYFELICEKKKSFNFDRLK